MRAHADLLVRAGRLRDATTAFVDLAAEARQDPQVRAALARVYQAMGLQALAVAAYGNPRTLTRRDRWARCRAWWRIGGPLWFVRGRRRKADDDELRGWPAELPASQDEPPDVKSVLTRMVKSANEDRRASVVSAQAEQLADEGQVVEAVSTLTQAIAADGPNAPLLRKLAEVERRQGRDRAALAHLAAAGDSPGG